MAEDSHHRIVGEHPLDPGRRLVGAVTDDHLPGDGLESGAKMLTRFDQDIALGRRIDAGVGETTRIEGFMAPFRDHDIDAARAEMKQSGLNPSDLNELEITLEMVDVPIQQRFRWLILPPEATPENYVLWFNN